MKPFGLKSRLRFAGAAFFLLFIFMGNAQSTKAERECGCDPYQRMAEKEYNSMLKQQTRTSAPKKVKHVRVRQKSRHSSPWRLRHARERIVRCFHG